MPAAHTTDETPGADFSMLDTEPPPGKLRPVSTQQPEGRSTTTTTTSRPPPRDSQDVKPERESKKSQADRGIPDTTTTQQRTLQSPTDARSGPSNQSSDTESSSSMSSMGSFVGVVAPDDPKEQQERSSNPKGSTTSTTSYKPPTRVALTPASYAQVTGRSPKDPSHHPPPPGATEGSAPRDRVHSSSGRPPNAQVPPGQFPEDERQEMSEERQPVQGANYSQGVMGAILSFMPAQAPKDKYQLLKDDYSHLRHEMKKVNANLEGYKLELRRTRGELRDATHYINELYNEKRRWKDHMNGLQNELNNVHHQLDDAKTLSEVRGKELFGAQVFLTKADTLSISDVGEKVTALNEEIFQAAATLGEALIHHRYELPQKESDAAIADAREMVGEKVSNLLISQGQKPEPEVNPLLVQVVLQIFMVKFCVSKIQSWYPSDPTIACFLNAIYSEIRLSEEQAVTGRWRALTRAHTRPSTDTWMDELSEKIASVLKIASWVPLSPENQKSFGHRLPQIFKAVNELRIAMGENVTSADLEVSVFDCGVAYMSQYMEDAYGDSRQQQQQQQQQPSDKRASSSSSPETVVGTTGIGLKQFMTERGANDNLQFRNVISAKIVLESTLKEALEPVQPSSSKLRRKKPAVENTDGTDQGGSRGSSRPKPSFI